MPSCNIDHLHLKPSTNVKLLPPTMPSESTKIQIEELVVERAESHQAVRAEKSPDDLLGVFKYDCLDRRLKRHHVTGKCPFDCLRDCSLMCIRDRLFRRGWHRSISDFGTDHRLGWSRWSTNSLSIRESDRLLGHAITRRDGFHPAGCWGDHGLPVRVCR